MSITVILARENGHGASASWDLYRDAENIMISPEGALTVGCGWRDDRMIVGAYPPGVWVNAYVDQDREWQVTS